MQRDRRPVAATPARAGAARTCAAQTRAAGDRAVMVLSGRVDPLVAIGLAACLRAEHGVHVLDADVATAGLQGSVARVRPDVVLLGEDAAHVQLLALLGSAPATSIVVLAHDPPPAYGSLLLALGASCVALSAAADELVAAIRLASDGVLRFVDADGHRVQHPRAARPAVTARELAVLSLLSDSLSYGEIGLSLGIKVETVRSHTVALRRKLGGARRCDLVGLRVPRTPAGAD